MPGKRNRDGSPVVRDTSAAPKDAPAKPMSAVAAARLRAQLQATPIVVAEAPVSPPEATSSSEIEEEITEDEPMHVEPQHNLQLCTWRYGKDYVSSETDEELTVSLNKNTTITLIGSFDFIVLKGAININGANYGAKSRRSPGAVKHRAYVPSTHPISIIRGLDSDNEIRFLDCKDPLPFDKQSPLFANIWNAESRKGRQRSFSLITETDADPLKRLITPEIVPEDWARQIEECSTSSTSTVITGAPLTGKSTFATRLINRYLTGLGKSAQPVPCVFFLDFDPSKPAYSPHGQISLVRVRSVDLGPSFTRASAVLQTSDGNEIIRAHSFPSNGLFNFQAHFIACAEDLIRTYQLLRQRDPTTPLIVNIPGLLCNIDLTLLLHFLRRLKPQRVVHLTDLESIDEDNAARLDALDAQARKTGGTVHHISAQYPLNVSSRSDADLRRMHMQSYFHCTGTSKSEPHHATFSSTPLTHELPWEFCYEETDDAQQDLIGFALLSEWVASSEILTVLNGSLIHIVETSEAAMQDKFAKLPRTEKFGIPYFPKGAFGAVDLLNPASSKLVCTALIRGWDPERKVVQLVVPKTHDNILQSIKPEKTVFVYGCCETPEWAYAEDAYYQLTQQTQSGNVNEKTAVQGMPLQPWVTRGAIADNMAYLNIPRRIRKFQQ